MDPCPLTTGKADDLIPLLPPASRSPNPPPAPAASSSTQTPANTHRIRLVPHLESYRSLHFDPVVRDLRPTGPNGRSSDGGPAGAGGILKIGRFTDKPPRGGEVPVGLGIQDGGAMVGGGGPATAAMVSDPTLDPFSVSAGAGLANGVPAAPVAAAAAAAIGAGMGGGGAPNSGRCAFKSKVVSRGHAEIWCEVGGTFYIRDTKSSSGTFLNHIRLSNPGQESKAFPLKDGDIIQLGVDYQSGTEEMYRCVKMKVEVGRQWGVRADKFNTQAMQQLKQLGGLPESSPAKADASPNASKKMMKASVTDCCICLFSVTVQQALFIAPCSHVFHYKCIRPLLQAHHPGFSCPLCRTFHDLEADVETEDAWETASRRASSIPRKDSVAGLAMSTSNGQSSDVPPLPSANDDVVALVASSTNSQVDDTDEEMRQVNDDEPSVPGPSLGGLAIPPRQNSATLRAEFGQLDAATPMNDHFLSTLAESRDAGPSGAGAFGLGDVPMEEAEIPESGNEFRRSTSEDDDLNGTTMRGTRRESAGGDEGDDDVRMMDT